MRRRSPGKTFEAFLEEHGCTRDERRACLEYLTFIRFRELLRSPGGLRFLFHVFAEDLFQ